MHYWKQIITQSNNKLALGLKKKKKSTSQQYPAIPEAAHSHLGLQGNEGLSTGLERDTNLL